MSERVDIDLTEPSMAAFIARCREGQRGDTGPVSTHAARRHIEKLLDQGMSKRAITQQAGVSTGYLWHLLTQGKYCSPVKEAALLSVKFGLSDATEIPAAQMTANLRALVAAGYDHAYIAKRLGKTTARIWELTQRPLTRCEVRTDRAVRELLDELTDKRRTA